MSSPTETGGAVPVRSYTFPPPRHSRETLDKVSSMFIVRNEAANAYDYYYAKLEKEQVGNYVYIIRMPNFLPLGEGFMVFGRKLYKVTLRDFLRRRVNVGIGPYAAPATLTGSGAASQTSPSVTATASPNVVRAGQHPPQPSPSSAVGSTEDPTIDLAWQEQISALLHNEDPEAEWDFV